MRQQLHLTLFSVVMAILGTSVPMVSAQNCANDGSGEAIQCRMGDVLSKNGDLLSKLQTRLASCDSNEPNCRALQRHLTRAENAQSRAMKAHGHTSTDNYNQLTLTGHYKRASNRNGGGSGNSSDTVDTSYDNSGPGSIGDTVSSNLDDASSALDDANTILENIPAATPSAWTNQKVYYFDDPDDEPNFPAWLHPTIDEKVWIPALFSIKLAANALEVVHTIAEHACNETLVALGEGGNVSAACTPLALAIVALEATADMMEFADRDLVYWTAKGGYINAQNAVKAGNEAGQIASDSEAGIEEILTNQTTIMKNQTTILANEKAIMDLLNTPQGQRAGFPAK